MSVTLRPNILNQYKTSTFIESGSYEGGGIQLALDCGFKHIRSVELDPYYYEWCKKRFIDNPEVKLFMGDTTVIFWDIIKDLKEPATFWLDGHYQYTVEGVTKVPLLEELRAIAKLPCKENYILIDDRRLMGKSFWAEVTQEMVEFELLNINPCYQIKYEDSAAAAGDIIAARL